MRTRWVVVTLCVAVAGVAARQTLPIAHADIHVDTHVVKGPMSPIWAWFGHDEPNYTYSADGTKLLSEVSFS